MNKELNHAIKQYYLGVINAMDIADIYYNNNLYSAACGYYQAYISKHKNDDNNYEKSYCLTQIAKCYLKQSNNNISNWQHQLIYECLKSAINYNMDNYKAYLLLGNLYKMQDSKTKDIYFMYEYIIMNMLDKIEDDYDEIANMIIEYYDLCEYYFICKYKSFENKIFKFINAYPIKQELYVKIINVISKNRNMPIDEQKITDNSIFK